MSIALQTDSVTKIYTNADITVTAVDAASLTVEQGEFVALVGPSGSGKTTMLALLAGLLDPTEGDVMIADENLWQMNDADRTRFRRNKIGFVFQESNLLPYLTARENVEFMLKLNGQLDRKGRERSVDLLKRLGLADRLNNLPSQLSGGQQQRVAIARSLIHDPAVVLADEPTASLDTERAYQVVQTFADLIHEHDRAGIMVTHDLRMCRFVDKVIQMRDGRVARVIEEEDEIAEMAGLHEVRRGQIAA